jgi:hypothetical protein
MLSSYLHLSLPGGLFRSGFPAKIFYAFVYLSLAYAPHLILLDFIFLTMFCKYCSANYEAPHYAAFCSLGREVG